MGVNASSGFRSDMEDFGIPISFVSRPSSKLWNSISNGKYDISYAYWSGGTPLPVMDLPNGMFDAGWTTVNFPDTTEVPMPVGNPDGDMQMINVADLLSELRVVTDPDRKTKIIQRLTWVCNQALPRIPVAVIKRANSVNVEEWGWPVAEENPKKALPRPYGKWVGSGFVNAKTK